MLNRIELKNFGPVTNLEWSNLEKINLIIGGNDTGKTFLLKSLYCTVKTLEIFGRGMDRRQESEILAEKLYWTFQAQKIGDLVTKGAESPLSCTLQSDNKDFSYSFGKDTQKQITSLINTAQIRHINSIFLPAKEVLSLFHIILKSRETDQVFGFDDTSLDLVRALRQSTKFQGGDSDISISRSDAGQPITGSISSGKRKSVIKGGDSGLSISRSDAGQSVKGSTSSGKRKSALNRSCQNLQSIFGGHVEFDEASGQWQFKKGKQKFSINITAEGVKKVAILDILIRNRYLEPGSIVFIDEPESALHPVAVSKLLDVVAELSKQGIQFFLASHSYFVLKKLFLIAMKENLSIPVISVHDNQWTTSNLKDGMPDNSIIDESIRLYKEEVEMALT